MTIDQLRLRGADYQTALPPRCYTDPDFLALELEKVFRRDWICIGHVADIPAAGDYITFDLPGLRVMAVRQQDGSVKVLSRVCRHRAALLGREGGGKATLFVCPYHCWTYELDGRLRGAPAMSGSSGFRREDCRLPEFRSQVWESLIFLTCSPAAEDLSASLEATRARLEPYRLSELKTAFAIEEVWNTNWKVAVENGSESYHHGGVHRQTLEPLFPTTGVRAEPGGLWYNMHAVPASIDFSFEGRQEDRPSATQLNPSLGPQQLRELLILGIYPNLVIAFAGACVTVFRFVPVNVAQTLVRATWLVPASYLELANADAVLERDRRTLQAIIAEDRASCADVQVGLSCLDAPAAGPLAPIERPIGEFGSYLRRRLCGD